jgi:putative phosphoribosyl transferase
MQPRFRNRIQAGRLLAQRLQKYAGDPDLLVLALPRGGVPVGFEVARALNAELDVFLVRKLGLPGHEELAMGAIASGGIRVINRHLVEALGVSEDEIEAVAQEEERELVRRERLYRGNRPPPRIQGRTVILVDDGLATGSTMRAAVEALRQQHPAKLVVAVPIAESSTCEDLAQEVDEIVCAVTPEPFIGVGLWYEDFSQTTDQEVEDLLQRAAQERALGTHSSLPAEGP